MNPELSPGKLREAVFANGPYAGLPMTCQVLDVSRIEPRVQAGANPPPANPGTRFKVTLSDGQDSNATMLATQLADMIEKEHIRKGSILNISEVLCNTVQGRRVLILLQLQVVGYCERVIGNPLPFNPQNAAEQSNQGAGAANGAPGYQAGANMQHAAPANTFYQGAPQRFVFAQQHCLT